MRFVTLQGPEGPVAAVEDSRGRRQIRAASGRPYRDVAELAADPAWREAALAASEAVDPGLPLLRPVLEPGAVVCVGLNYKKHIIEMGRQLPEVPTLFTKLPRALTDPGADIALPQASKMVDYEGELCVVIGQGGRNLPRESAMEAVFGLTLCNDTSMRDFQRRSLQFFAGKTWERASPVGPVVVTIDELGGLDGLAAREISTRVNGQERQRAPISELLFDVPTLVSDLSQMVTLRPGDLIATGTPAGVGDAMKPPVYLQPGDVVEISLDGIGTLRSRFV
jgi:acylpyruvate hydrolase